MMLPFSKFPKPPVWVWLQSSNTISIFQTKISFFKQNSHFLNKNLFFKQKSHLDNPPVVDVLEGVAGDLLLMTGSSVIRISQRVDVFVGMKPAWGLAERVAERDL